MTLEINLEDYKPKMQEKILKELGMTREEFMKEEGNPVFMLFGD